MMSNSSKLEKRIVELEKELKRLRKILWLIIWDNKGFTQEDIDWAGEYELKLANKRIVKLEKGIREHLNSVSIDIFL